MNPAPDLFGRPVRPQERKVEQIPLPLGWQRHDVEPSQFLTGRSNAEAFTHVHNWRNWTTPATLLIGPRQSGRSTLAVMFAADSGGEVIDGIEGVAEDGIFHSWNRAQESGRPLLLVANSRDGIEAPLLPDLLTRMATMPRVEIAPPDPELAAALLQYWCTRSGRPLPLPLAQSAVAQLERSYAALHAAATALIDEPRAVTVNRVIALLRDHGLVRREGLLP